jgi:hypothetical protein
MLVGKLPTDERFSVQQNTNIDGHNINIGQLLPGTDIPRQAGFSFVFSFFQPKRRIRCYLAAVPSNGTQASLPRD